jgi:hypothetical protein
MFPDCFELFSYYISCRPSTPNPSLDLILRNSFSFHVSRRTYREPFKVVVAVRIHLSVSLFIACSHGEIRLKWMSDHDLREKMSQNQAAGSLRVVT